MNKVRIVGHRVVKQYTRRDCFAREAGVLNFVREFRLSKLVPQLLDEIMVDSHLRTLCIEKIEGEPLAAEDINHDLAGQLGTTLAIIHGVRTYETYGAFGRSPTDIDGTATVTEFLLHRLDLWRAQLLQFSARHDRTAIELRHHIDEQRDALNALGPARFAHNDFRFDNILICSGRVVGVVDWEFAGAYPAAWDVRKLIPMLCWRDKTLSSAFDEAYRCLLSGLSPFPSLAIQWILVAVDCLGAITWAHRKSDEGEAKAKDELLMEALSYYHAPNLRHVVPNDPPIGIVPSVARKAEG